MLKRKIYISIFIVLTVKLLTGCGGCEGEVVNDTGMVDSSKLAKFEAGTVIKFNGRLFSIPSPIEIADLIRKADISYNKDLLNPISNNANYTTSLKQALNLGVYGADLTYINIYEEFSDGIKYFNTVKYLSNDLNILNSFTEKLLKEIEENKMNKDSMLMIISKAFKNADKYLVDNERNDIAVLVLAGSWVESMYLISQSVKEKQNQKLIDRIGDQKHPLDNLIELLKPYYNHKSERFDKLLDELIDLAYVFDGVDIKYTYNKPKTIASKKLTIIRSKSQTIVNENQLKTITDKIEIIRKKIIE